MTTIPTFEKKSLNEAMSRAVAHSIQHPTLTCYVVDKKRYKAAFYTVPWIVKEQIVFGGYHEVATITNGVVKMSNR